MQWIKKWADRSKEDGRTPLLMIHHNMAPHMECEPSITFAFTLDNYLEVSEQLADWGIHYSFSGHLHTNDIASVTNDNGETEIVKLPAPPKKLSESPNADKNLKPYAQYKISAYLNGYYQIVNSTVPIFSGVTSIQRINMIPLPSYTTERKVINIAESEPNL